MKKHILILYFVIFSCMTNAQNNTQTPNEQPKSSTNKETQSSSNKYWYEKIELGAGVVNTYSYDNKSSQSMLGISVSISNLYLEFATNLTAGKGTYLNLSSPYSYAANKTTAFQWAIGWNVNLFKNKVFITPKVGSLILKDINQDPLLNETYYYSNHRSIFLAGFNVKYFPDENYGVGIGTSTTEMFNIQVVFRSNNLW